MSQLQVEISQLRAFGTHVHAFGVSNIGATSEATRVEAGQTADDYANVDHAVAQAMDRVSWVEGARWPLPCSAPVVAERRRAYSRDGCKGAVMWWLILGAVAVLGGVWVAIPTLVTFLRPDFEPIRRNDDIVFQAQQTGHP